MSNPVFWNKSEKNIKKCCLLIFFFDCATGMCNYFVCVEVLRPSQPNGVMSSAVSLPNHMFTGQA